PAARRAAAAGGPRAALAVRAGSARPGAPAGARRAGRPRGGRGRRARRARRGVAGAVGGDDDGAPVGPGGGVVTEAAVWEALAEVEDPELPVVSVVELGVVRGVRVEGERVHVELTPTVL